MNPQARSVNRQAPSVDHPHTSCHIAPVWDPEHQVLSFEDGSWARGLTKTLDATFAPDFSARQALQEHSHGGHQKHGRKRGNKIDRLMTAWATTGKKPQGSDPSFQAIQRALEEKSWLPVAAQVPVGCFEMRLATKIDLVCQTLQGSIILVELKCGFNEYWDVHDQGYFRPPFERTHISCRNKAFLQLLMSTYLYQHTRPAERVSGAYVLHVVDDQYRFFPLPFWLFCDPELVHRAVQRLSETRSQTSTERDRVIRNGRARAKRMRLKNQCPSYRKHPE